MNSAVGQKNCSRCGLAKTAENYYSKGARLDSKCKICALKTKSLKYKAKQRETIKRQNFISSFNISFGGEPDLRLLAFELNKALKD